MPSPRKRIELHNIDKYQPYLHAPLIDRIEGDAEEMILSADGNEASAGGNTVGSLSINASGGVWTKFENVLKLEQEVSYTLPDATDPQTILTFDKTQFQALHGTVYVKEPNFHTDNVTVLGHEYVTLDISLIHDGSDVTVLSTSGAAIGTLTSNITGEVVGDDINLTVTDGVSGAEIKGVVTLIK